MTSDLDLLEQYARENREEAFATLLDRHLKLVYSAALRQVRSPELAEEVAQSVFVDLARGAEKLKPETILTAWLYEVTRRSAIDVVRRESRRQLREQIAFDINNINAPSSEWTLIEPLLDEAMEALDPPDRTAILLRYFEDKSLREVGLTMGTSEDAAQKRVSRALEGLRQYFSKRGQVVGVGALAAVISTHAVQSAPLGLKALILTSAAVSGAGASTLGALGMTKALAMTTLQKTIIGAMFVAALGAGLFEARRVSTLQGQVQILQRHQAPAAAQKDALRQQLEDTSRQLAALQAQNAMLRQDAADVLRLRAEVGRLRDVAAPTGNDPTALAAKSWLARVGQLKQRLEQTPSAKIPELQFLTEQDWLNAAKGDLTTDEDYRRALSGLRAAAESTFITTALKPALNQYEQANQGQFPTDISQLQPYFNPPVDDSILQRWEVAPQSTVPSVGVGGSMITQVAPVDADYDNRNAIGLNGWGTAGPESWDAPGTGPSALMPALKAYAAANNGAQPTEVSQLAPYVSTPTEQAALQKAIQRTAK